MNDDTTIAVRKQLVRWLKRVKTVVVHDTRWSPEQAMESSVAISTHWVEIVRNVHMAAFKFTAAFGHTPKPWTLEAYCHQIALVVADTANRELELTGEQMVSCRNVQIWCHEDGPNLPEPSVN